MTGIEYFYSAHSSFTYLGSARFLEIARAAGREVVHRPVHLDRVVEAAGSKPFRERTRAFRAYFFEREMERWAEEREVALMTTWSRHHYVDMTLANCMLIACAQRGLDTDRLSHAVLAAHWVDDADPSDPAGLTRIAASVDVDAGPLLADAASKSVRAEYEANTEEAIQRSVFGAPTYFVDGDMFYGQDRLELLERSLRLPYRQVRITV